MAKRQLEHIEILLLSFFAKLDAELPLRVSKPGDPGLFDGDMFRSELLAESIHRSGVPLPLVFRVLPEAVERIKADLSEGETHVASRKINDLVFELLVTNPDIENTWAYAYRNLFGQSRLPILITHEGQQQLGSSGLVRCVTGYIADAGGGSKSAVEAKLGKEGKDLLVRIISQALQDLGARVLTDEQLRVLSSIVLENPELYRDLLRSSSPTRRHELEDIEERFAEVVNGLRAVTFDLASDEPELVRDFQQVPLIVDPVAKMILERYEYPAFETLAERHLPLRSLERVISDEDSQLMRELPADLEALGYSVEDFKTIINRTVARVAAQASVPGLRELVHDLDSLATIGRDLCIGTPLLRHWKEMQAATGLLEQRLLMGRLLMELFATNGCELWAHTGPEEFLCGIPKGDPGRALLGEGILVTYQSGERAFERSDVLRVMGEMSLENGRPRDLAVVISQAGFMEDCQPLLKQAPRDKSVVLIGGAVLERLVHRPRTLWTWLREEALGHHELSPFLAEELPHYAYEKLNDARRSLDNGDFRHCGSICSVLAETYIKEYAKFILAYSFGRNWKKTVRGHTDKPFERWSLGEIQQIALSSRAVRKAFAQRQDELGFPRSREAPLTEDQQRIVTFLNSQRAFYVHAKETSPDNLEAMHMFTTTATFLRDLFADGAYPLVTYLDSPDQTSVRGVDHRGHEVLVQAEGYDLGGLPTIAYVLVEDERGDGQGRVVRPAAILPYTLSHSCGREVVCVGIPVKKRSLECKCGRRMRLPENLAWLVEYADRVLEQAGD